LKTAHIPRKQASGPSDLVVTGDPLGSRILALLLRDSGYRAKVLPTSSLDEPGVLQDIRIVVLTPRWELSSTEQREALLASLKERSSDMGLIVVELTTLSEEWHTEGLQELPSHKVPWPCRISELEQRIEAALRTAAR
jgi:DNA-binding response OmpR family regulator